MDRGAMGLLPGDHVDQYEIEGSVARGGMAVVYRARDLSLGRPVALKVIAPELAGNERFRRRFVRESEVAASIDHPNVIPIYQAGNSAGLLYIAMRYVDGPDLRTLLADCGRLTIDEVLGIFTQVASALDAAHAHGLVHRDVKPGNILLSRDGASIAENHVYLTDFGLTKRASSLSGLSVESHFLGTIAYVSPEQISGLDVTARTDVYALGCVIYECLVGVPPFERDDDAALLWAHLNTTPLPASELRRELPPAVDVVLNDAMAKDPAARTESCQALIAQMRTALGGRDQASGHPEFGSQETKALVAQSELIKVARAAPRLRRWVSALVAVLVIVLAVVLVVHRRLSDFETYDASIPSLNWATFEHPRQWTEFPDVVKTVALGTCVCTGDYNQLFEVEDDWTKAFDARTHGVRVEGAFASPTPLDMLSTKDTKLEDVLGNRFIESNTVMTTATTPVTIAGSAGGWQIEGSVTRRYKADTMTLTFRLILAPSADGKSTYGLLLFSEDPVSEAVSARLDRVQKSITIVA